MQPSLHMSCSFKDCYYLPLLHSGILQAVVSATGSDNISMFEIVCKLMLKSQGAWHEMSHYCTRLTLVLHQDKTFLYKKEQAGIFRCQIHACLFLSLGDIFT